MITAMFVLAVGNRAIPPAEWHMPSKRTITFLIIIAPACRHECEGGLIRRELLSLTMVKKQRQHLKFRRAMPDRIGLVRFATAPRG